MTKDRSQDEAPAVSVDASWDELCAVLPAHVRVAIEDGVLDGLSALHQAIFAIGSGSGQEVLGYLRSSVARLTMARDMLAAGVAAHAIGRAAESGE